MKDLLPLKSAPMYIVDHTGVYSRFTISFVFCVLYLLQMFRQSSPEADRTRRQSEPMAALHRDTSRRSQDTSKTHSNCSLHNSPQCSLHRVLDSLSSTSIHTEHKHGPPQAPRHVHARLSRPQHIPRTLSVLPDLRPIGPPHHRSSPRSLSASEDGDWVGSFDRVSDLGWGF